MFARSILIAAAVALGAGSAAAAEPAKAPPAQPAEQQATAVPVLMASANVNQTGASVVAAAATEATDATAAPASVRAARGSRPAAAQTRPINKQAGAARPSAAPA